MTDLERAREALGVAIVEVAALVAAARREGAEAEKVNITALAEEAYSHGAEEMRERAAARLRQAGRDCESRYPGVTIDQDIGDFAADIVRALPLTPEDATSMSDITIQDEQRECAAMDRRMARVPAQYYDFPYDGHAVFHPRLGPTHSSPRRWVCTDERYGSAAVQRLVGWARAERSCAAERQPAGRSVMTDEKLKELCTQGAAILRELYGGCPENDFCADCISCWAGKLIREMEEELG